MSIVGLLATIQRATRQKIYLEVPSLSYEDLREIHIVHEIVTTGKRTQEWHRCSTTVNLTHSSLLDLLDNFKDGTAGSVSFEMTESVNLIGNIIDLGVVRRLITSAVLSDVSEIESKYAKRFEDTLAIELTFTPGSNNIVTYEYANWEDLWSNL